ncbi:hypothetical protein [Nocardioides bruguierae]|uniref:MinD-like ATPase involved in chromosome partitioning or flagellar assembly n=1 Tax=Nocardioides bruguierae TaxID=2945102 RepID=A0A9X2IGZ0_9ACTN|nr:hypothetical protein [Nocardioides bruguierae]MCM0621265.1 hypothetical protein [Nocardioides bruguierae]
MSLIALASAKGSPGVTVTAVALAQAWPDPVVLADVDPAAGDVAWRLADATGEPADPERGLLSLGAAARRGAAETTLGDHLQDLAPGFPALVGVPGPEQLGGIGAVWTQLSSLLREHTEAHGGDVLVDAGRVVPGSPAMPLLAAADAVVLVVRPDLEGVAHLRTRLHALRAALRLDEPGASPVGVLVVSGYRDTGVLDDLQRVLDMDGLPARVLGLVAHDPKGVRVLHAGRSGDPRRTLLGRSVRGLLEPVRDLAGARTPEVV